MTSFEVLVGGAAELDVHLLNDVKNKKTITQCIYSPSLNGSFSLPSHCSPWQMQCGQCHHAGRNGASYVPPHQPQPSQSGSLQSELVKRQYKQANRPTCFLPTNADLYVVAIRGVFEVVNGAHHVQGHVADVMGVIFCLLWSAGYHHVSISNRLHLRK